MVLIRLYPRSGAYQTSKSLRDPRACCHISQPVPKVLADHLLNYSVEHVPEPAVVGYGVDGPLVMEVNRPLTVDQGFNPWLVAAVYYHTFFQPSKHARNCQCAFLIP